ncbi:MAG: ATP-binding protein, partial [Bacteroidota bacterium]|nr:ATP-binding protein [Bacteroidota bacterium]
MSARLQKNWASPGLHFTEESKNMVFNRFRIAIITRISLLLVTGLVLTLLLLNFSLPFTTGLLVILEGWQIVSLIRVVERTNRKLISFLESINYNDFSIAFSDKKPDASLLALNNAFNNVMTEFRKSRIEKEENYNYLQTIVQHISIGIIVFTPSGKVVLTNDALFKLTGLTSLKSLKELKHVNKDLPESFEKLKSGEKILVKIFLDDKVFQLSVFATEFKMHNEAYTLLAIQDISSELEEKEIESWQKLIRVLTHEIMNSITPISSL